MSSLYYYLTSRVLSDANQKLLKMDRNGFLKTTAALLPFPLFSGRLFASQQPAGKEVSWICPPYLKAGDTIGITSPSGYILEKELLPAIGQIKEWGLKIRLGATIGQRDGTFGGTDLARAKDFQQMLDDPHIKAILCARGGYGAVRIIDKINFTRLRSAPKWIIGFSDVTVFHSHIGSICKVATLHAKMCNSFPTNWQAAPDVQKATILSIRDALMNKRKMSYLAPFNTQNRPGEATAKIIGGNLRTIENLSGTASGIQTAGHILFIEETHEYLYNMDRMLWNLERSGQLSHLKGLIVGAMIREPQRNPADELNRSLYDLVLEKTKAYSYPVCFDFPVGHIINNFALKCGIEHHLAVKNTGSFLLET